MRKTDAKVNAKVAFLQAIEQGANTCAALAQAMKKSRAQISRLTKEAIKNKQIRKKGYPYTFRLTEGAKALIHNLPKTSGGDIPAKVKEFSVHGYQVKFPIITDNSEGKIQWMPNSKFKNAKLKSVQINEPIPIHITHTGKNIVVSFAEQPISLSPEFSRQFIDYSYKAVHMAHLWLAEHGLVFDLQAGKTIQQHIATTAEEVKDRIDRSTHTEVGLGRLAASAYQMSQSAKAYIDWSPRAVPHLETNDLKYADKFAMMPEWLAEMYKDRLNMQEYNKNLKLHLKIQREQAKTLKLMQAQLGNHAAQPFRSKQPAVGVS